VESEQIAELGRVARVCVAITYHHVPKRLPYLRAVLRGLSLFPVATMRVVLFTNLQAEEEIASLKSFCDQIMTRVEIRPTQVEDPFMLTWAHKPLIGEAFNTTDATHFVYLEDDMHFTYENFLYFIQWREPLRQLGLIPSFLRTEVSRVFRRIVTSDNQHPIPLAVAPTVMAAGSRFAQCPSSYCAMFVLDRELAAEYRHSPAFSEKSSRSVCTYEVRERSAMGLSFINVPAGFIARYVVRLAGVRPDPGALMHHVPNNYARSRLTAFGKVPISRLFVA